MFFMVKKIVTALLLPPAGPLLIAALGFYLWYKRPRIARGLVALGIGLLWLLATPLLAQRLIASIEYWPPLDYAKAKQAQAIVVLGNGTYFSAPEYGGDTVNRAGFERLRYAALVARKTGLPLLTSGGAPLGGTAEAELMREVLTQEFGLRVRWVEKESVDTRENARFSAMMLREDQVKRVVLVTHASHMRRALDEFRRAELEVVAAPTAYSSPQPFTVLELLPDVHALTQSRIALHELLGRLANWIKRLPA